MFVAVPRTPQDFTFPAKVLVTRKARHVGAGTIFLNPHPTTCRGAAFTELGEIFLCWFVTSFSALEFFAGLITVPFNLASIAVIEAAFCAAYLWEIGFSHYQFP
jgi:hypothetical protein